MKLKDSLFQLKVMGAVAAPLLLAVFFWKFPDGSAEWAAWVQAGGALFAIAVAIVVSTKQAAESRETVRQAHELAIGAKRQAVRAVVDAAVQRMREIQAAVGDPADDDYSRSKLFLVYHSSVIRTMSEALNAAPLYEIGSADAVQALLRFKDQFAFFGVAVQKYYEGPNADQNFRRLRDEIDESQPDERRQRRDMTNNWDRAQVHNMGVHIKAMEEHYTAFIRAVQA